MTRGFVKFDDLINKKLENPEFKERYEKGKEIFNMELLFNEILRNMGREDLFVEVKDMSEY